MADKYVSRVKLFIEPYLRDRGLNLILVRFDEEEHNHYLRVFIELGTEEIERRKSLAIGGEAPPADDEGYADLSGGTGDGDEYGDCVPEPGVSIDDCVNVSRYLSKWLDREDFIKETYTLEVCSGGFLTGHGETAISKEAD